MHPSQKHNLADLKVKTLQILLAASGNVGFTDYELGSKQLSTVLSTQVKCAEHDAINAVIQSYWGYS